MKREFRAPPIVAIFLLLLPVLYIGSYLANVKPGAAIHESRSLRTRRLQNYRLTSRVFERVFWPMEQIDRRVRPGAWSRATEWETDNAKWFHKDGRLRQ